MRKPSPCKGCVDRYGRCHAECVPFKAWDKEDKEIKAEEDKIRKAAIDAIGIVVDGQWSVKKSGGGSRKNGKTKRL